MKWILNINKNYKRPYILANMMLIFFDSIGFVIPIAIGYIVDKVTVRQSYDHLFLIVIGIIVFVIIKHLGSYLSVIKLDLTCHEIIRELKEKCYQNINKLDYYFFEHNNKGELMTNFTSDTNQVRRQISYNIKTMGAIIITFLCSLVYLLTINIPFTVVLLTPGILVGIASYRFLKNIKPEYEKSRDLASLSNDFISDNIEGNKVVKTFALEQDEIKRMRKVNTKGADKYIEISLVENKFYQTVDFFGYLMNVIFLLVGGYLFIKSRISMGELIIFNAYLYNLNAPFFRLSGLLNSVERYQISKARLQKLVDAKPQIVLNGEEKLESLLVPIEFRNVRIVYDNKVILENLNLKIKPYETVAFIGKTGSGKSSIVNLLLGFIVPESGELLINNKNYLDYRIKDLREKVGYVTQSSFLFSDTIYNNIKYGAVNTTKEEAEKYASIACCDYIGKLPEKLDTIIGERGVGLSGGEKQRLSLARALAVKPDILLLDDITSALDIETEEKINESIKTLEYKSTKIIIASKIVSVMNADKIYVLDQGKVIEEGTHKELLKKKGYYYELYNIQKGGM
ncbi:MAG: ABC transporter ATP-binding protein/permease [Bacilli bacterium]|nr:ABC transporter ATP-binding protein/permease [Bacilli bacterium]